MTAGNVFYPEFIQNFVLVATRLSLFFSGFMISPLKSIPVFIRTFLLVIFAFALTAINSEVLAQTNVSKLYIGILNEFLTSAWLMFPILLAYAAILTIGKVVDMQIGFGAAGVVNPNTDSQEPLLGSVYVLAFTTTFFIWGLHAKFLGAVSYSFTFIQLGAFPFSDNYQKLLSLVTANFTLAIILFSPIMLVVWCVDVIIGFLSKTMPQMNIYFVTLPLKIFIGLTVAGAGIKASSEVLYSLHQSVFNFIDEAWR